MHAKIEFYRFFSIFNRSTIKYIIMIVFQNIYNYNERPYNLAKELVFIDFLLFAYGNIVDQFVVT